MSIGLWLRVEIEAGGETLIRADAIRTIHEAPNGDVWVGIAGRPKALGPVQADSAKSLLNRLAELVAKAPERGWL